MLDGATHKPFTSVHSSVEKVAPGTVNQSMSLNARGVNGWGGYRVSMQDNTCACQVAHSAGGSKRMAPAGGLNGSAHPRSATVSSNGNGLMPHTTTQDSGLPQLAEPTGARRIPLTPAQLQLLAAAQSQVKAAEHRLDLIIATILAGHGIEKADVTFDRDVMVVR